MTVDSPRLVGPPPRTAPAGRRFRQPGRPRPSGRPDPSERPPGPPPAGGRDSRLPIVTALTVPVVVMALAPPLQFEHGPWLSLCLAAPVVVWGAAPFHRAAGNDLRRASVSTEAAVSLAVTAGFLWSVLALFLGDAATEPPSPPALWSPGSTSHLYLAPIALLTGLALAARHLASHRLRPAATATNTGADRVGAGVVVIVGVTAAATVGFWLAASGDAGRAAASGVAVVVLASPAGLLLATPLVLALARRRATDLGVRIDCAAAADVARRADTLVVRRTGTLTTGRPWLVDVVTAEGVTAEQTLRLVGSLARRTRHPVGRAVVEAARERCLPLASVEVLAARPGLGARGVVDGHIVVAGRERFVAGWARRLPGRLPGHLADARTGAEAAGQIALLAAWDDAVRAVLIIGDPPRPTAADAIAALTGLGVHPVLVSGDTRLAAMAVADVVGVAEVVPGVLPDETAGVVARLRAEGRVVVTLDDRSPADLTTGGIGGGGESDAPLVVKRLFRALGPR